MGSAESQARRVEAVRSNGPLLAVGRHILWRRTIRTRLRARSLIGQYPALYLPLARWKRRRQLQHSDKWGIQPERNGPVFRDTDAVIEGFPRSANTFAAAAFALAQTTPVRLAHHLHVPSQI